MCKSVAGTGLEVTFEPQCLLLCPDCHIGHKFPWTVLRCVRALAFVVHGKARTNILGHTNIRLALPCKASEEIHVIHESPCPTSPAVIALAAKGILRSSLQVQSVSQGWPAIRSSRPSVAKGEERASDADGHIADVRHPRVAWKTGTSAGNRDAWCIAYNPEYVVGVWIGNPAGKASTALVGCSVATPVALGIFRSLYPNNDAPWFERPRSLKSRPVCKTSGLVPNASCPVTVADDFIPGITISAECIVHRGIAKDGEGKEVCEIWPPGVADFLTSRGLRTTQVIKEDCSGKTPCASKSRLQIMSPGRNETFRLVEDMPPLKQEISLTATTNETDGKLYWFVDNELYRTSEADEYVSWPLRKGRHVIACCDATGTGDSVEIIVE